MLHIPYFEFLLFSERERGHGMIFNKQNTVLFITELSKVILFPGSNIKREWFNSALLPGHNYQKVALVNSYPKNIRIPLIQKLFWEHRLRKFLQLSELY